MPRPGVSSLLTSGRGRCLTEDNADAVDTLARTVYGEGRGELFSGQVAVAWVVKNRADRPGWWGHTVEEVCRKPFQFSCWNASDPNRDVILAATLKTPGFIRAYGIACLVLVRDLPDPTQGGTNYHSVAAPRAALEWPPEWTRVMIPTVQIGGHQFYRDET